MRKLKEGKIKEGDGGTLLEPRLELVEQNTVPSMLPAWIGAVSGIHFFLLFSLSKISVLLCVSTLKMIVQGLGGKRRETTLRIGDESLNFEISDGLVREKNRLI